MKVNGLRLLVMPYPADNSSTNTWRWEKPEGMSYKFTPSKGIKWLGEEGSSRLGVETEEAVIGILEFDDKVRLPAIRDVYRDVMSKNRELPL